jgi:hypothetical protein
MDIPLIPLDTVYHVGTLDPSRRGANYAVSQEGSGLSVSLCPYAWMTIAALDGDVLELARTGSEFVDIMAIDDEGRRSILAWAVDAGLVEEAVRYRGWEYDVEFEEWRYSLYESVEKAEEEIRAAAMLDDDDPLSDSCPEDVELPEGVTGQVQEVRVHVLTPLGLARASGFGSDIDAVDLAVAFHAEDVLMQERPSVVGVWWNETLDPARLSAPRGAVFPSRVAEFSVSPARGLSGEDDRLEREMPEPVAVAFGAPAPALG